MPVRQVDFSRGKANCFTDGVPAMAQLAQRFSLDRRNRTMQQATRWLFVGLFAIVLACSRAKPAPKPAPEPVNTMSQPRVRDPAVAGTFYPSDPDELRKQVEAMLSAATQQNLVGLRALISPHAGYRYSGPIAASGFKQLIGRKFERVVVLGPSHRVAFHGVAIPDVDAMRTPLGVLRLSPDAKALAKQAPFIVDSAPHAREHSLEVELPFLQVALGQFDIMPLVFGDVDEAELAKQLDELVNLHTFFVASSDLSHYYPYEQAKALDQATVQAILGLDLQAIRHGQACGKSPILALVHLARLRGWKATLLDLRNSGDTAGDRSRVVGYASIALTDA
jgi:MEMO1 family protein